MQAMQENLTPREQEIFDLLLDGTSPKDIVFKLGISLSKVDYHRNNMYRKLGVKGIHEFLTKYGNGKNNLASRDTETFNSLASEENPLIIIPYYNNPYSWHYYINFPMFLRNKITAGDVYTFTCKFTSSINIDEFRIGLAEHTIEDDENGQKQYGYITLFNSISMLSKIKANFIYESSSVLQPDKTASSKNPIANNFTLDTFPYTTSQSTLTFTRFELEKTN